jgi:hypothetical protein
LGAALSQIHAAALQAIRSTAKHPQSRHGSKAVTAANAASATALRFAIADHTLESEHREN